jgi:hypothetical protein
MADPAYGYPFLSLLQPARPWRAGAQQKAASTLISGPTSLYSAPPKGRGLSTFLASIMNSTINENLQLLINQIGGSCGLRMSFLLDFRNMIRPGSSIWPTMQLSNFPEVNFAICNLFALVSYARS